MMWKPTKFGQYLLNGSIATVILRDDRLLVWDASRDLPDVQRGPWSLLAPDWQPGAPTVEQLSRWGWWALALKGDEYAQIICGKVSMSGDPQHLYIPSINIAAVVKSAPIQPDLLNGPLWVPLEVCK